MLKKERKTEEEERSEDTVLCVTRRGLRAGEGLLEAGADWLAAQQLRCEGQGHLPLPGRLALQGRRPRLRLC